MALTTWLRRIVPQPLRALLWRLHWQLHLRRARRGHALEPDVSKAIRDHLRPGMTALDVGANQGLLSLLMADRVGPHGKVIAFEPYPPNLATIRKVFADARLADRVDLVPKVVSDGSADHVRLYFGRGQSCCEINILGKDIDGQNTDAALPTDVPAVSLDHHLSPDRRVDLVKIDVEGAESLVLRGMQRTLKRHRPTLIIEVHSPDNWQHVAGLRGLGYQLTTLEGQPLNPADHFPARHVLAKAA